MATPELSCSGAIAAPLHSAQSSVRVNAPHRNRDHRAYGAVRHVHSFFPYEYSVTDARISDFGESSLLAIRNELQYPRWGMHYAPFCFFGKGSL